MIYNKKVTAIVPFKSETEIVNGNIRLFNNRPLCYTLLDKLENIFIIDEIIVDTDIGNIESELKQLFSKVKFILRAESLSSNETDINSIISYDLSQTENHEIFIQTHINKPLLKKETITRAIKQFVKVEDRNDSLFSVNKHQSRFYNHENRPLNHEKDHLVRTKKLDPIYEENSCFYIFTKESFSKNKHRIGSAPFLFETSSIEALELDEGLSYKLAEILMLYQEV